MSLFNQSTFSIGIITFNNKSSELKRYVNSLIIAAKQYSKKFNVDFEPTLIVMDNGASSNLNKIYKQTKVLKSKGNIGYTAAFNVILKSAFVEGAQQFVLSSNPDGAFHPEFFIEMQKYALKYPNDLLEGSQFPEEHPKKYDPKNNETLWASGCCCLFSKEIFEEIGYLDENFFMYVEDVDYSWRVRLNGRKIRACTNAKYAHFLLNRAPSAFATKCFYDSGRYMALKWGNKKFQKFCEETMLKEKIYTNKKQFKKHKIKNVIIPKNQKNIINFEDQFYFSSVRWHNLSFLTGTEDK